MASSDDFGPLVAGEAQRRGFYDTRRHAFPGDGLKWNWTLTNNAPRMDYPSYRGAGLPVSTSMVEALIKEKNYRVKGTEKFWIRPSGAETILQVRAAGLSDDDRLSDWILTRTGSYFYCRTTETDPSLANAGYKTLWTLMPRQMRVACLGRRHGDYVANEFGRVSLLQPLRAQRLEFQRFHGRLTLATSIGIIVSITNHYGTLENEGGSYMKDDKTSRRDFLKQSSALPILPLAATAKADETPKMSADKFQPEEFWRDRMEAPKDGKKHGWFVDTRRCFGCHACEVSCKAENDVPLGNFIRQTIYKDVGEYPKVARMFLPMSCQHCEDAPCIKACPCGALHKEAGGTVAVDYNICCGHATCVEVCPYGAIYMDPVAKQAVKCHNCYHRTENGMEPACVPTCPSEALYFGDLNDPESKINRAMAEAKAADGELTQLRPEKETRPRVWFAGLAPAEIEDDLPGEGESYSPEAYSIYSWKKQSSG